MCATTPRVMYSPICKIESETWEPVCNRKSKHHPAPGLAVFQKKQGLGKHSLTSAPPHPRQHFLVALLVPSLLFCLTQVNHGKVTASKPPKSKPWIRLLFPFSPDFPLLSSPSNAVHHSLQSRPISIIPASSQIPRQRRHPNVTALLWSVAC